jgi:hypothetical protein
MKQEFIKHSISSINTDVYRKSVLIDEVACMLGVLEMVGQTAQQNPFQNDLLSDTDAFILVYSRQNRSSFGSIPRLRTLITGVKKNQPHPVVLIGLDHGYQSKLGERQVSHREGADLAEALRCGFIQCPVTGADVEMVFFKLIRAVRRQRNLPPVCCEPCQCKHGATA